MRYTDEEISRGVQFLKLLNVPVTAGRLRVTLGTLARRPDEFDRDNAWSEYAQANCSSFNADAHRDFNGGWAAYAVRSR
jgi:hypothetical protein